MASGCDHTEPFRPGSYGSDQPLHPGTSVQLTFNPGQDLLPAWTPDGKTVVYTAERRDRPDHDRCLAFLPAGGGSISRYVCRTTAADDSLNVFAGAALAADSILYTRASNDRFVQRVGPDAQDLVVARVADPNSPRVLQRLPFTTPWGRTYDALADLSWLPPHRLAAIGQRLTYPQPCRTCAADTVATGLEIVIIDFAGAAPVFMRVAGGDSASSVAASTGGDTLYFTRDGDSRVYRYALAGGAIDTLYDFGGLGIARDVAVASGRVAAIVGGAVSYAVDSTLGGSQPDHGGPLFVLSGGSVIQIGDSAWLFRHPALSPDGSRLVVSAWNGAATADIWEYAVP